MPTIAIAIAGFVVVFAVTALVLLMVTGGAARRERLAVVTGATQPVRVQAEAETSKAAPVVDPLPGLTEALERTEHWDWIQLELLRAGLLLRPSEALLICVIAGATGLIAGWMLNSNIVHGVLLGGLAMIGVGFAMTLNYR